jgi:adenosylcobinamide-phosphate synthase
VLEGFICYQLLATKSLKYESMKVYKELKNNDLEGARNKVSMIVGRDTKALTEEGITKATVETIAENTSDGIIAPMIYMIIGGAPLGLFYKAVNTMDSMVGYKNDKYFYFGRASAKLDDVLNYIPARISAYLMIVASFILKMNGKNAYKIYKRDRYNHASPNSAHTEAVCAGALEVQLAGDAYYFGKLYKKKTIGDALRPIEYDDIRRANLLLYVTSIIGIILFSVMKSIILYTIIK